MGSQAGRALCERIVAQMPEAVIVADREGVIQLWNRGAESVFGYTAAEAVGQSLDIIIPDDLRARHWEGYQTAITTGRTRLGTRALPTRAVRKGGDKIYVELSFAVIHDEAEAAVGALAVGRNITERHVKDRELRRRLAELETGTAAPAPAPPAGEVQ
jgi:PAS domain S-box-containing protein